MEILDTISDVLHTKGEPCDLGCNEADFELVKLRLEGENSSKPIRAVKNWSLWDIDVNATEANALQSSGLQPVMIYASKILWDSHGTLDVDACVRSTLLVRSPENFLCETRNTIYILVGPGTRKAVAPSLALSIIF